MASHDLRLNYQPQLVIAGFQPSTGVSLKIRFTFFRFGPVVGEAVFFAPHRCHKAWYGLLIGGEPNETPAHPGLKSPIWKGKRSSKPPFLDVVDVWKWNTQQLMVSSFSMNISVLCVEGESIIKCISFQQKRMVTSQQFNIDTHNSHIWSRFDTSSKAHPSFWVSMWNAHRIVSERRNTTPDFDLAMWHMSYVCSNHKKFNRWHWVYVHYFFIVFWIPH